jgi:hypothetical protein
MSGMFCACSSSDESNSSDTLGEGKLDLFTPIDEGDDYTAISDFFQSNKYYHGLEYLNFVFEDSDEIQCYVINNTDELLSKYIGVDPFPIIDFNKYTLIVGQKIMPESFYTILRQELLSKGDELILNVYVPKMNGGYCAFQHLFFWGLYPKLQSTQISVNIIKEQV